MRMMLGLSVNQFNLLLARANELGITEQDLVRRLIARELEAEQCPRKASSS